MQDLRDLNWSVLVCIAARFAGYVGSILSIVKDHLLLVGTTSTVGWPIKNTNSKSVMHILNKELVTRVKGSPQKNLPARLEFIYIFISKSVADVHRLICLLLLLLIIILCFAANDDIIADFSRQTKMYSRSNWPSPERCVLPPTDTKLCAFVSGNNPSSMYKYLHFGPT